MEEGAKLQGTADMGVTAWPEELPKLPGAVRDMASHKAKHAVTHEKDSTT
jgi:hypothetical protein